MNGPVVLLLVSLAVALFMALFVYVDRRWTKHDPDAEWSELRAAVDAGRRDLRGNVRVVRHDR